MSIAGGYHRAVQRAHVCRCDCLQLFTKSNSQWGGKPITPEAAQQFIGALQKQRIGHPVAHASYLINLASPDRRIGRRSVNALVEELRRAATLYIPCVVVHPGAYTSGNEARGLRRIARALDEVHARTEAVRARCLLETTAGQGTALGWRFEHLAAILDRVKEPQRLGVCFDTCHVFAAGYSMQTAGQYCKTMEAFDALVGLGRIQAFHLNDSRRELGARVDRHAHIGQGQMGIEPFRRLLADPRFRSVPMYLETPKGHKNGTDLDVLNLRLLRRLAPK